MRHADLTSIFLSLAERWLIVLVQAPSVVIEIGMSSTTDFTDRHRFQERETVFAPQAVLHLSFDGLPAAQGWNILKSVFICEICVHL
jgi:hypothetical protein